MKNIFVSGSVPDSLTDGELFPADMSFEVSNVCNMSCVMCDKAQAVKSASRTEKIELTAQSLKKTLQNVSRIRSATLSGSHCEPYLNRDLMDIVDILKGKGALVRVITNASVLNDRLAERSVTSGLDIIAVSLHGASSETAQYVMGRSDFEKITGNITRLAETKNRLGSETPAIQLLFVGMKMNIHELSDFVALASRVGASKVLVKSLMERAKSGLSMLAGQSLVNHPELLVREFSRASGLADKLGVALEANAPYSTILSGGSYDAGAAAEHVSLAPGHTRFCLFPFEKPFVEINGSVKLCCAEAGRDVVMGNAREDGFASVWNGGEYSGLRRSLLTGEGLPGHCRVCERAPGVTPIVMQMHIANKIAARELDPGAYLFARKHRRSLDMYLETLKGIGVRPNIIPPGTGRDVLSRYVRNNFPLLHGGLRGMKAAVRGLAGGDR